MEQAIYEYKVIEIFDSSGRVDIQELTETLNNYGNEGWHLISAYSNELGKNEFSIGGFGINSTTDQNILILERIKQTRQLRDGGFEIRQKDNDEVLNNDGYEIVYKNGRKFALKNSNLYCPSCHGFIDSETQTLCSFCGSTLME